MATPTAREKRVTDAAYKVIAYRIIPPLQKRIYPVITRLVASELLLLNNGYEEDPPMGLPLDASDEPSRFQIQLYHRVASQGDLSGKRVLEVGCGHGGGASYLVRTMGPTSYTGLDLNPTGIAFCRKTHNLPGLDFVRGDAENLPFPDESFDAVINIESSHCYPQFQRFLAEVARVLRPGGQFLYADGPHPMGIEAWQSALTNGPLQMLSERDISIEIARGLENVLPHALNVLDHRTPAFLHGLIHKIVGTLVTSNARVLECGQNSYWMYSFAKP